MKKYTIHMAEDRKVTLECCAPEPGPQDYDLVCKNDEGEVIAYFYSFLYWHEVQADRNVGSIAPMSSVPR